MPSRWGDERDTILEEDIQGLKYFRKLWPLFERLRDVGRERDKAGNRELFMDQYCALVLLFLFNPCVRSLRALQQASQLKNVQRSWPVRGPRSVRSRKRPTCLTPSDYAKSLTSWPLRFDRCGM